MDNFKNMRKAWNSSLSFLDNSVVSTAIIVILVLYSSTIFDNINSFVGSLYSFSLVKLVVLLLIIYVAPKDTTIAILLAVSYLVSLYYMVNNETFLSSNLVPQSESNMVNSESLLGNIYKNEYFEAAPSPEGVPEPQIPVNERFIDSENPNNIMMENNYRHKKNIPSEEMIKMHNENNEMIKKHNNEDMIKMHMSSEMNNENFYSNKHNNKEHFFPSTDMNSAADFDVKIRNNNSVKMNNRMPVMSNNNVPSNTSSCMNNYVPQFESVGNLCEPVATYKNELNAQGLNSPEGFNSLVTGSPL
jgi:hypothetical protein